MGRSGRDVGGLKALAFAISGAAVGAIVGAAPAVLPGHLFGAPLTGFAGRHSEKAQAPASTYEVLAFEAPGCAYCTQFRNDMARSYDRSGFAALAPVRFVEVTANEIPRLKLAQSITIVPTAVVMRDGVEVGRIGGYVGRDNFYRILETLIAR